MTQLNAKVEFAPDGKHWQVIKGAKRTMGLWDYFNFSLDIRQQLAVNPLAKFRLIGESNTIIGTLPRKE